MIRKAMWLVIVTMVVWSGNLRAAPGDLDTTFDTDGMVTTDFGNGDNYGLSVAIQAGGKIVVAGGASNGSNDDFAVARYNNDGALDTGFGGGDGMVTTDFGNGNDAGYSVAIQADGKIVVAGYASNGSNYDFAVARYNNDGALDTGFGTGGKVLTDFGNGDDHGCSVAIQADGKIVVAGVASNGSNYYDFAVARYTTAGALDTGFGTGGKVLTDFGNGNDVGYSVAIQADGKIVVAGGASTDSNSDFAVARYSTAGALDTGFGTGGKVLTDLSGHSDSGFSVAIQAGGKIVVAGEAYNGSNYDFAVARYNNDGALDTGFGIGGKVLTDFSGGDHGYSVAIQADGKIVVAGVASYDFAVARYNNDGALDTGFGIGGKVLTDFGNGNDFGFSVAVQADGKIVVAGGAYSDFAVARYLVAGPSVDLEITKLADTSTVAPGEIFSYSIDVANNGPDAASSVVVTDALPRQLTYVSDTCGASVNAGVWTWNIGSLSNGASDSCSLSVQVNPDVLGQTVNTAQVECAEADPDSVNNQGTAVVTVAAQAIPTMGSFGMFLFIGLIGVFALVFLRRMS